MVTVWASVVTSIIRVSFDEKIISHVILFVCLKPCNTVGERTDISLNIRTDDGLTHGASIVNEILKLQQPAKPSGIIWVQFDHADIGKKTRNENRHLYVESIESTSTSIKPVTLQFTEGKNSLEQYRLLEDSLHYDLHQLKQFTGHRVLRKVK